MSLEKEEKNSPPQSIGKKIPKKNKKTWTEVSSKEVVAKMKSEINQKTPIHR